MSYKSMLDQIKRKSGSMLMSQKELAYKSGISETRISKVLNGHVEMTARELLNLMQILGIKEV